MGTIKVGPLSGINMSAIVLKTKTFKTVTDERHQAQAIES